MSTCHNCGKEIEVAAKVSRADACPFCRADLRCCRNCRFFDPARPKQCREPMVELVREKTKANYCEFFSFAAGPAPRESMAEKVRADLDALFKGRNKNTPE